MSTLGTKSYAGWKPFIILLLGSIVLIPVAIWTTLFTGYAQTLALMFVLTVIFVELARLAGPPLTKQEAGLIFIGAELLGMSATGIGLIYNGYYRQSPAAYLFNLQDKIPYFVAPMPEIWKTRSFLHQEWIVPIVLSVLPFGMLMTLSLGFLTSDLFMRIEPLPFPVQVAEAETIKSVAERVPDQMRIFSVCVGIAFVWGLLVYALPTVTAAYLSQPIQIVSLPWIEFNSWLQLVIPGASMGLTATMTDIGWGFILPFHVVLGIFIGTFATQFVGNSVLVSLGLTEWAKAYAFGISMGNELQLSSLYVWAIPSIGVAFVVTTAPLIRRYKKVSSALHSFADAMRHGRMYITILSVWFTTAVASGIVMYILAPDIPIWIIPLVTLVFPLVFSLVGAKSLGETGFIATPNYLPTLLLYASGYSAYNAWFVVPSAPASGAGWCGTFKLSELLDLDRGGLIQFYLMMFPIILLLTFIYTQAIWQIAPIPSKIFRGAQTMWPISATLQSLLIVHPEKFFRLDSLLYGMAAGVGLYGILAFIPSIPGESLAISIAAGLTGACNLTPTIGALTLILMRKLFGDRVDKYRWVIGGGLMAGESIAIVVGVGIALLLKATWAAPI